MTFAKPELDDPFVDATTIRNRKLPPWGQAVLIGVVSRLFAIAVLAAATALQIPEPVRTWQSPVLIWDSEWYLSVARTGYHAAALLTTPYGSQHDYAFFPLWPALMAAVGWLTGLPLEVVGPILANVLFVLALIPIYRLTRTLFPQDVARWGLLFFAFNPAAYVYSTAYAEPLFYVATATFFAVSTPAGRGALAAFAQATRLTGAALALAEVPELLHPETRWRALVALAAAVLAFAGWWVFIAVLTSDPRGFLLGSPSWYAADGPAGSVTGLASILEARHGAVVIVVVFLLMAAMGTLRVVRIGREALPLGIFAALCVGSAFLETWNSMPRLAAAGFPAFAGLAATLPTARSRWLVFVLFAASEVVFGALSVSGYLVP